MSKKFWDLFHHKARVRALACGAPLGGIAAAGLAGWFK